MPVSDISKLIGRELKFRANAFQLLTPREQAALITLLENELQQDAAFIAFQKEEQEQFLRKFFDELTSETFYPQQITASFIKNKILISKTKKNNLAPSATEPTVINTGRQVLQWSIMVASVGVGIAMFVSALVFPPAILPLLGVTLALNALKFPLGIRGLSIKPNLNRTINLVGLLSSLALISIAIAMPPAAPVIGIAAAIFLIGVESYKAVKDISAFVLKSKKLSESTLAPERKKLALDTIERGIKIGFAMTVIGLAVGSFFFPPLAGAAITVATVGALGFAAYKKWAKPAILRRLMKEEEKLPADPAPSIEENKPTTAPQAHSQFRFVHQPVEKHTSLRALRKSATSHPIVYKRADETSILFKPEHKRKIELAAKALFGKEITQIEVEEDVVKFHFMSNQIIGIHALSIGTNSPENPRLIENIAKLAKAIGWQQVKIGNKLTAQEKITAIDYAKKAKLEVIDQEPSGPSYALDQRKH